MTKKTRGKKALAEWLNWLLWFIFFLIALLAIGYFSKRIGVL